jgi:hypothetical protein
MYVEAITACYAPPTRVAEGCNIATMRVGFEGIGVEPAPVVGAGQEIGDSLSRGVRRRNR